MLVQPLTLNGAHVCLSPLEVGHAGALLAAAADGALWRSTVTAVPGTPEAAAAYVDEALTGQAEGRYLPFVISLQRSGLVVGTTRYRAITPAHRRLEIGSTWLAASVQRSAVNTEAKRLLLAHAFEVLGCLRVELLTDALNQQSRRAILRLGAVEEGLLRQHMCMPDGRRRDSVVYSILDHEWPAVRDRLDAALAAHP